MSKESRRPGTTPAMSFQIHSPRSEDGGVAVTSEAFLSTVSKSGEAAETLDTVEPIAQSCSIPKILGKFSISSKWHKLTFFRTQEISP